MRFLVGTVCFVGILVGAGLVVADDGAPTIESLLPCIDGAISKAQQRPLHSEQHSPWVVLHALIAFEGDVQVIDAEAGERLGAVEYLLTRAEYGGQRIFRDDDGEPALPTRGISYGLTDSLVIQDHVDQFLMVFAAAGVGLDRQIVAEGGRTFSVDDMLEASKRGFRSGQELGWTLVAMSTYLPPGKSWTNDEGDTYKLEDVVALATARDPRRETEGGPHHLYGVAYALRKHGTGKGAWADAESYLRKYADLARSWQQDDGAFSGDGFRRNAPPRGPRHLQSTTGHALEWISVALPADQLKTAWARRAVFRLCSVMNEHAVETFSDGGLYHGAHALRLYRDAVR